MSAIVASAAVGKGLWELFQSLLLPLVDLRRMNAIFGRNLVDGLVSGKAKEQYEPLQLTPNTKENLLLTMGRG